MSGCINQDAAMCEPRVVANESLVDEKLQQTTGISIIRVMLPVFQRMCGYQ